MKKQFLLLAGTALIMASCGSNSTPNNQQATIDSIAKANAAMQDVLNKQKNDSTINALAKSKADSIEASNAKHNSGGNEHHSTAHKGGKEPAPAATPTVAPAPAATGMRAHSDQTKNGMNSNTNTGEQKPSGGMRSHSDQSKNK